MGRGRKFLDDIDDEEARKDIWEHINKLFGQISHLVRFQTNVMIYRIVKNGYMKIEHLEEVTGLTKQRIYQIVNAFEEKEIKRRDE